MLHKAHQALSIRSDKHTMHYKDILAVKYAELVYNGLWYTRVREALDAFVNVTRAARTRTVRVKLYKGNVIIAGRRVRPACIVKIMPRSARKMSTTSVTPKASSNCSACR